MALESAHRAEVMFEPNSTALVVTLFAAAAALIGAAIRLRWLAVKIVGAMLAIVLSATAGIAIVNDYYGYYQTWSQLAADLSGSYAGFVSSPTASRTADAVQAGTLRSVTFAGARSGITRSGLVYLPPQYFQPAYRHTTFPVVELLHGTPGQPTDWIVHLHLTQVLDTLIADHAIGPMIVVMPSINSGRHFEECVNAPGALDDTYISQDVPADVRRMFRASPMHAEWGIAGYSSGGYCAVNLAMRHPTAFGAAAAMDGYVRPTDGPAAGALHFDPAAENANNPLLRATELPRDAHPLPSFWLSAGTGDRADIAAARAFTAALHGVEQVTLYREPGAAHNFYAWRPAVPQLFAWLWTQLAPPSLRVQFPIAGPPQVRTLPAPLHRCRLLCVAQRLSARVRR